MTACLLTFDVEDWFQVENLRPLFPPESWESMPRRVTASTRVILRLLEEQRLPATFFFLGWVAEHEPALVEEIAAAGHEIASHGYGHILPLGLAPGEFRTDILRARSVLQTVSRQEGLDTGHRRSTSTESVSPSWPTAVFATTRAATRSLSTNATATSASRVAGSGLASIGSMGK